MPPLLEMLGIRKSYGGAEVLHGVGLVLRRGEVLALLGENGAGKSTLMKVLTGDVPRDAGEVLVDGRRLDLRSPRDAHRAGVRMIHQELSDAPDLSVAENVLLGELPRRRGWRGLFGAAVDWPAAHRRAAELLDPLGAGVSTRRAMRGLGVGQRQLVEIARALSAEARVLVMDEPTAALTPREVDRLFRTIAVLRDRGVGIIYISHRLDEVERIADHVMVLRDGNVAGVSNAAGLERRRVVEMMVGHELPAGDSGPVGGAGPAGDVALEVAGLSRAGAFDAVSFSLRAGETVGLFGLLGAGQLEVARAVFGAEPATAGTVRVGGRAVRVRSPRQAKGLGIGLVPEERKTEALVPDMSVADNLTLSNWPAVSTAGVVRRGAQLRRASDWVRRLGVRARRGPLQPVGTLSGGNQQKVVLARWLEAGVRVLLLNEPTRGVDVKARADIYAVLKDLRAGGLALLVCSSDLEEVLEVSDRVIVFARGRVAAEFRRGEATRVSLLAAAAGGPAAPGAAAGAAAGGAR